MQASARYELIVLGIGQDAGNPHIGCRKTCCRDARRACLPACLAIVDRQDNQYWLIDATPRLPEQVQALHVALHSSTAAESVMPTLAGILLTHAHMGHYTGLMYLGREAMNAKRLSVFAMPQMRAFLENNGPWDQLVRLENITLKDLSPQESIILAPGLSIEALPVPHRGEYSETVAFVISGPQQRALYLPDIDTWETMQPPLTTLLQDVDVAWLDATFYDEAELPSQRQASVPHPPVVQTLKVLSGEYAALRSKVRLLHFNHSNPLLDSDSAACAFVKAEGVQLARELEKFFI